MREEEEEEEVFKHSSSSPETSPNASFVLLRFSHALPLRFFVFPCAKLHCSRLQGLRLHRLDGHVAESTA
jgi:hypothetical protein